MSIVRRLALAAGAALTAAAFNEERARAAERAHPPQGRLLEIDGVRLHVVERGSSSPVLYLHGNGGMIQEIEATGLIEALAREHRMIAFDRPGFGHSTRPRGMTWTAERQAALIAAALDELNVGPAIIVAHSWGTLVAMALALRHSDFVRGLVLMSGFYYPERRLDEMLGILAWPGVGDALRQTVMPLSARAVAPLVIQRVFAPNPVTRRFSQLYPVSLAVRPSQLRALGEENGLLAESARRLCGHYGEIACPAVIMAGTADRIVASEHHSVRLARDISHAHLELIEGVGHMLPHIETYAVLDAVARVQGALDRQADQRSRPEGNAASATTH